MDLSQFLEQEAKRIPPSIESLPALRSYRASAYPRHQLRDPFAKPTDIEVLEHFQDQNISLPKRPKSPLQSYPLEELQLMGFVRGDRQWALFKTPDGSVHRVSFGQAIGDREEYIVDIKAPCVWVRTGESTAFSGKKPENQSICLVLD